MYTGIFPFIALSYMNLHIFLKIRQSRQVQKTLEQNCVKYPTQPRYTHPDSERATEREAAERVQPGGDPPLNRHHAHPLQRPQGRPWHPRRRTRG